MADYYSVLARAVLNLETADDPAARKELYEARRFIVAELRKQNPQISAQAIRREQAALEAAVRRIEAEIPQTTANEKTGRQGSPDSEVVEARLARHAERARSDAVRYCISGRNYRVQWRDLSAGSCTRLRKHHSLSTSARRNGSSGLSVISVVPHGVPAAADV
jgi:hypothetical protein